jgi:hypothetical protein
VILRSTNRIVSDHEPYAGRGGRRAKSAGNESREKPLDESRFRIDSGEAAFSGSLPQTRAFRYLRRRRVSPSSTGKSGSITLSNALLDMVAGLIVVPDYRAIS